MKKVISFGIAVVMALTMATCVSAKSTANKEITDLIIKLGIMQGDADGNLRLEDTITRAETAKMVMRVLGLNDIAQTNTAFYDVTEDHWASGYINGLNQMGVINGNGDGCFYPDENVTNEQLIKMIVIALGYKEVAEAKGSYPFGYLIVANDLKITKGLEVDGTADAIRNDVAIMIYNSLDIPMREPTSYSK